MTTELKGDTPVVPEPTSAVPHQDAEEVIRGWATDARGIRFVLTAGGSLAVVAFLCGGGAKLLGLW